MSEDYSKKKVSSEPILADKPKKVRKLGIIGAFLWGVLAFFAPSIVLVAIAPYVYDLGASDNIKNFILALIYELTLIALVAAALRFYSLDFKSIGFGKFKLDYLKVALLAFAVYLPLSIVFLMGMSQLLPINVDEAQEVGFENLVGIEMILTFLLLVIITPFAEELLFRGLIFTGFRNKLPFWAAAVTVSALFAVAHWQANVALDVFVMSLISCYIREKSGSLWPSIFLHVFKNGLAFILLFVVKTAL